MTLNITTERRGRTVILANISDQNQIINMINAGDVYVRRERYSDGTRTGIEHRLSRPRKLLSEAKKQQIVFKLGSKNPGPIDLGEGLTASWSEELPTIR